MRARDRAGIERALQEAYGVPPEALAHLAFYETSGDRVYASTAHLDPHEVRTKVHRVGVYLAKRTGAGLRLSMEGAWLLAPHADPDAVHELDADAALAWLRGESLPAPETDRRFLLLVHGDDVLGGTVVHGGKLHNRVPKVRRVPRDDEDGDAGGGST